MQTIIDKWITEYIKQNYCVSATDQPFHEAFFAKFGGKRNDTFGVQTVYKAQRRLKKLWDDGILERHRNSFSSAEFPRWVYVYKLREPEWIVEWSYNE